MLTSCLCTQAQLESPQFRGWLEYPGSADRPHRKDWEYAFVLQALSERGLLSAGYRGLGFAVGRERLPSIMASKGTRLLVTDLEQSRATAWAAQGMHAANLSAIPREGICPEALFLSRVSYRNVDMTAIPNGLGEFDFMWSCCAMEHIGGLQGGKDFIVNSLKHLKPGGVAVHTTEYNVSSNERTIDVPCMAAFRHRDIEDIFNLCTRAGASMSKFDFNAGFLPGDKDVEDIDYPRPAPNPHLKVRIGRFVCTSAGLIITKK